MMIKNATKTFNHSRLLKAMFLTCSISLPLFANAATHNGVNIDGKTYQCDGTYTAYILGTKVRSGYATATCTFDGMVVHAHVNDFNLNTDYTLDKPEVPNEKIITTYFKAFKIVVDARVKFQDNNFNF